MSSGVTTISRYSEATIPTTHGKLTVVVYREAGPRPEEHEHMAIVAGPMDRLRGGAPMLTRVHSECWTGETLGSLKCDCREQLDGALAAIEAAGRGVVVYLRQEGRGIGLGNKIAAYALQAEGADTVEANEQLGFAPDLRSYDLAAAILRDLGVDRVALMTNNPDKCAGLEKAGIVVAERVPHWGGPNEHNRDYLQVKRDKLGHHA
ncbi:MAG TPA: GTP cyclohydrolase II [Polyangia bacterium]|nr:GTP cyclohydrolase II [Polyangia bacterium]HWE30150.1 GTP cyclohydrolase II [Polyangia bacterium]